MEYNASTETINHDKQIKDRDEIIKAYLETEIPNSKSYFCNYFKRGLCHFSAKECKFAHGAEDFVFNKEIHLDLSVVKTIKPKGKNKKASKGEEKKQNSIEEEDIAETTETNTQSSIQRPEQKSIKLEKAYIKLYEYQLLQKEQGKIEKVYSLEEIGQNEPVKAALRRSMLREVGLSFYDLLFRELKTNALKTTLVDAFFTNIGWTNLLPVVNDNIYAFEQSHPTGTHLVKLPKREELLEIIEDNIISLITSLKLFENLPISPSIVRNHYYKEIAAKKPFEPNLYVLEKNCGLKFDEYLQQLQQSTKFKSKLATALGKNATNLEDAIIFESASNEKKQFCEKVARLVKEYMDESPLGIETFAGLEKKIAVECSKEIKSYSSNASYVRKLIRYTSLRHKILIIYLKQEAYLLSLHKLNRISQKEFQEVYKTMNHNCKESNPFMTSEFKFPPFRPYEPKEGDQTLPNDPCTKEFLEKEMDFSKIVLVDSLEKLEYARSLLPETKVIGVDLEGTIEKKKDRMVELVQCAYGGMIVVFDIYFLRREAQNLQNETAQKTYQKTLEFLQEMMENPTICKVFHDGREDSLGLHSCIQSCVLNTFDVSANYNLIAQLEVYSKYDKVLALDELKLSMSPQEIKNNEQLSDEKCEEILKNIEVAARPPGLNDVLEGYEASHGINRLKSIMRDRFFKLSRGYFLQRPVDKEHLIYSAKDVEDLEEVMNKMIKRLEGVLKNICDGPSSENLALLTTYISYLYTNEGCTELANP